MRACIFCQSTTNKASMEHLFHEAFGKRIPHSINILRRDHLPEGVREKRIPKSMYETKVGGTCKVCNEGWMNRADLAVEETVVGLANGTTATVPANQIAPLALWASKVALMRTEINRSLGWNAPEELFHYAYNRRLPAPGTVIRIGLLPVRMKESGANGCLAISPRLVNGTPMPRQINIVSWGMNHLYVHVILSSPAFRRPANALSRDIGQMAGPQLRKLWPNDRRAVTLHRFADPELVARIGSAAWVTGQPLRDADYAYSSDQPPAPAGFLDIRF